MKVKTKRLLKAFLKFGLTAGALYYVFSKIEFSSVLEIYSKSIFTYLLLALLFFAASKALSAFRLNILFKAAGLDLPHALNLKLYLVGMFYNLFLPGGIGGDGYKIYLLQKHYKTGTGRLFGAVLVDRLSGMTALLLLALLIFTFKAIPLPYGYSGFLMMPFVLAGLYFFMKWFYSYLAREYPVILVFSISVQILQVMSAWMILLALGVDEYTFPYLLVFLVSSLVAMLPISVGGIGLRELTFLYGAKLLGIDPNIGVSVSLMFYIITAVTSFTGLWYIIKPIKFTSMQSDNTSPSAG